MNVLSLFDGMSCGRIALERAGVPVTNYYASEIDKFAIRVSEANYPDIIRLGDVRDLDVSTLPKIHLLIGGSPCTDFSFAGKRSGMETKCKIGITNLDHYLQLKSDGFEFTGQSYLFWEYMRVKRDLEARNPDLIFLLENVVMVKKWEKVLSEAIGCEPIMIDSQLVSAQKRKRLYWTNIEGIEQPADRGILLKDILEPSGIDAYTHSDAAIDYMGRRVNDGRNHWERGHHNESDDEKANTVVSSLSKGVPYNMLVDKRPLIVPEATKEGHVLIQPGECFDMSAIRSRTRRGRRMVEKANCVTVGQFAHHVYQPVPRSAAIVGRKLGKDGKRKDSSNLPLTQCLETAADGEKSRTVSSVTKDTLITNLPPGRYPDVYNTLEDKVHYRKLTPVECERLQTVPDNYTQCVSDSQRYKMVGNGWTVDVITHMLLNIPWFLINYE